jgi:hypothetical protein
MIKLEKFNGVKIYMFPNGALATPDAIRSKFPAVDKFTHVIEVNGDVCQAVMNLNALRQMHGIDKTLSEADAIVAIETIINAPTPEPAPDTNERIAAALEFQNLMMMEDAIA